MAYVNATINEGSFGSFQADTAAAVTIPVYTRVKYSTTADTSGSGKPTLVVAAIGDRGVGVTMQPIAAGSFGTIKFLNSSGEQFGQASGTIGLGVAVYTAASGKYSVTSTGGALLAGFSTTPGYDGGPFTWLPNVAAA